MTAKCAGEHCGVNIEFDVQENGVIHWWRKLPPPPSGVGP